MLKPKQRTVPPRSMAQVWSLPAASMLTFVRPLTVTGVEALTVVPLPSCPKPLLPQHFMLPSASRAQL